MMPSGMLLLSRSPLFLLAGAISSENKAKPFLSLFSTHLARLSCTREIAQENEPFLASKGHERYTGFPLRLTRALFFGTTRSFFI